MDRQFYCLHCKNNATLGLPLVKFKGEQICAPFCSGICFQTTSIKIGPKRTRSPGLEEPPSKIRKGGKQEVLDRINVIFYPTIRQLIRIRSYDQAVAVYEAVVELSLKQGFNIPEFVYEETLPITLYTHVPNNKNDGLISTRNTYEIENLNRISGSVGDIVSVFKERDSIIQGDGARIPIGDTVLNEIEGIWIYDIAKILDDTGEYQGVLQSVIDYEKNATDEVPEIIYMGTLFPEHFRKLLKHVNSKTYDEINLSYQWLVQTIKVISFIIVFNETFGKVKDDESNMNSPKYYETTSKLMDVSLRNISTILNYLRVNKIRGSISDLSSLGPINAFTSFQLSRYLAKYPELIGQINIHQELMAFLALCSGNILGAEEHYHFFLFNKYLRKLIEFIDVLPNGRFLFECTMVNGLIIFEHNIKGQLKDPEIRTSAMCSMVGGTINEFKKKHMKTYSPNELEYFAEFIQPVLNILNGTDQQKNLKRIKNLYSAIYEKHRYLPFKLGSVRKEFEYVPEQDRAWSPDDWYINDDDDM